MIRSGHGATLSHGKKEEKVKKVFLILIIIIFLAGCRKPFYYELDKLKEEVISAEIVELSTVGDFVDFDIVNKVDSEKLNSLISDLSMIEFEYGGPPDIPTGYALKLNYAKGFELICNTYIMSYNKDGEPITHKSILASQDEYNEFILKYKIMQ